jgi:large subunit ribosomal protein L23
MELTSVIKKAVITEKSHQLVGSRNTYTLAVDRKANKPLIREAVEKLFGVKVLKVSVLNKPEKMRRTGKWRKQTKISGYKKAIINLKTGDKIPLFEVEGEKKK